MSLFSDRGKAKLLKKILGKPLRRDHFIQSAAKLHLPTLEVSGTLIIKLIMISKIVQQTWQYHL
jgi:hypothetical protein